MADANLQVVINAKDNASRELKGLEGRLGSLSTQFRVAGMACLALGAAGLKLATDSRKLTAQLSITAAGLGITTETLRTLALETSNVTFPLEEVTKSFDLLLRSGMESEEAIARVATAFDTLGDAINVPAGDVTAMLIPAMKTFNVTAEEMAGKTDSLLWLFRNTTVNLDDFNRMVGYVTPELVAMGLTTEDMIGILADLDEQGYSGIVMTRAFMSAVTLASKEQIPLNEALGITTANLEGYKEEMDAASGMTQEYADLANYQYGIVAKLKHGFKELTVSVGAYLEPLEGMFAALTGLAPLLLLLSSQTFVHAIAVVASTIAMKAKLLVSKLSFALHHKEVIMLGILTALTWVKTGATIAATAAQWALNVAMTANPIGLIIMAIAALVVGIILLVKNWDKVKAALQKVWEKIKALAAVIKDKLIVVLDWLKSKWDALIDNIKKVNEWFNALRDAMIGLIMNAINWLISKLKKLIEPFQKLYEWVCNLIGRSPGIVMLGDEMQTLADELPGEELIEFAETAVKPAAEATIDLVAQTAKFLENLQLFKKEMPEVLRLMLEWLEEAVIPAANMMAMLRREVKGLASTYLPELDKQVYISTIILQKHLIMMLFYLAGLVKENIKQIEAFIDALEAIPRNIVITITTIHRDVFSGSSRGGGYGSSSDTGIHYASALAGGAMPDTGLATLQRGAGAAPAKTIITIPVYLDGELITEKVIEAVGSEARLRGY